MFRVLSHSRKQGVGRSKSGSFIYTVTTPFADIIPQLREPTLGARRCLYLFPLEASQNCWRKTSVSYSVQFRPVVAPAVLCHREPFSTDRCYRVTCKAFPLHLCETCLFQLAELPPPANTHSVRHGSFFQKWDCFIRPFISTLEFQSAHFQG